MYRVYESSKGYSIFFVVDGEKEYISDNLSLKQANKWCIRLNNAYIKGCASNW